MTGGTCPGPEPQPPHRGLPHSHLQEKTMWFFKKIKYKLVTESQFLSSIAREADLLNFSRNPLSYRAESPGSVQQQITVTKMKFSKIRLNSSSAWQINHQEDLPFEQLSASRRSAVREHSEAPLGTLALGDVLAGLTHQPGTSGTTTPAGAHPRHRAGLSDRRTHLQ